MTDIEERANKCANENNGADNYQYFSGVEKGYIRGATDQDPISRADERKKVIEKACEWFSNNADQYISDQYIQDDGVYFKSEMIEDFKQAMEK